VAVYDPSDVPLSAVGDCMSRACDDASESLVSSFDPKDPKDDDAQCTTDVCTLMGTVYQPSTGTPCNEEGGAICLGGSCVPFIPVKCSVTATAQIYDGCDGLEHVGVSIEWSGLTPGSCAGSPTDVGYCPFGESCSVSENGGEPQLGTCL
jgi:hypothetical protein